MSFHKEDGVGSLCHKALQIISELCLGGQVEWEKCSGIFPLETTKQGIGTTGKVTSLSACSPPLAAAPCWLWACASSRRLLLAPVPLLLLLASSLPGARERG